MFKCIWVLYFLILSILWFIMWVNFVSVIKFNLFCISDYIYSALHLWLGKFCFALVICTFCGIIWWITGTIEYRLGMSTFVVYKLIPELSLFWTVWDWFSATYCVVFFRLLRILRVFISVVLSLYSLGVDYILYTLHT